MNSCSPIPALSLSLLALLASVSLLVSGCAEEESCSTGGTYTLPTIEARCSEDDSALECREPATPAADGKSAWFIIGPRNFDCGDFTFADTYYAKTEIPGVSCDAHVCTATTGSAWTDSNGAAITKLAGGTYRFCVWIDIDGDDAIVGDQTDPRTVTDQDIDSCDKELVMTGFFEG